MSLLYSPHMLKAWYRIWIILLGSLLALKDARGTTDLVYTHQYENIYFVCTAWNLGRDGLWPPPANLDSVARLIRCKGNKQPVVVYVNMGLPFHSNGLSIGYGKMLIRAGDGTFMNYSLPVQWGEDPIGIVIYYASQNPPWCEITNLEDCYQSQSPDWRQITNLVEYSISNVDSIRKYQEHVCITYPSHYYDWDKNTSVSYIQTDTVGSTIDRGLLWEVARGNSNAKIGFEPAQTQQWLNALSYTDCQVKYFTQFLTKGKVDARDLKRCTERKPASEYYTVR